MFDEIRLEHLIINHYQCGFFEIKSDRIPGKTEAEDMDLMQVVFSSKDFTGMLIKDRVHEVLDVIKYKLPDLLENYCIIVHPYDLDEFQKMFDYVSTQP